MDTNMGESQRQSLEPRNSISEELRGHWAPTGAEPMERWMEVNYHKSSIAQCQRRMHIAASDDPKTVASSHVLSFLLVEVLGEDTHLVVLFLGLGGKERGQDRACDVG